MSICAGWKRGVPCACPPDRIVFAPDGTPRLVCSFHALPEFGDIGGEELRPDGLPADLLKRWKSRELDRQRMLRTRAAALQAQVEASERRLVAITDELRGQPVLPLEERTRDEQEG